MEHSKYFEVPITCTHTHTGQELPDDFQQQVLVDVVKAALDIQCSKEQGPTSSTNTCTMNT